VLASLASASPARAERTGMEGLQALAYVAAAVVVVDVGLTAYDVVVAAKGELPAPGFCVAEMIVAAPQIPLALTLTRSGGDTRTVGYAAAAWTTALVAHGVWGLVASARHADDAPTGAAASALRAPSRAPFGLSFGGAF
jgi:hypothetical protein